MIWYLIPVVSIIGFAAAIDHRRKKNNNQPHQTAHPDSHAANGSSFASGDQYGGGGE